MMDEAGAQIAGPGHPLRWRLAALVAACLVALAAGGIAQDSRPHFEPVRESYLIDEPIPLVLSGAASGARVTLAVRGGPLEAASEATFVADATGRVDPGTMAPVTGRYAGVDPMGLFWSTEQTRKSPNPDDDDPAGAVRWTITAQAGGAEIARTTVLRRAVDPAVTITPVRENGIAGTFYAPPGTERHPAFLVLTGSNGGMPPAAGPAGGFASRGYATLALAYFNYPGLPPTLSNIPIEYFGTALTWLAEQPSVDPARIGVIGVSRGAELALLLGVAYPQLHAVIAYAPSNVINGGCCDRFSLAAWTLHGQPLAVRPVGLRGSAVMAARPQIAVEHIQGPILLISGKDDGVWESDRMADAIVSRLQHNHFAFDVEHLSYDHAGHAISRPYTSSMVLTATHPLSGNLTHFGGTPQGNAHAREDAWRHVLAFVDAHFGHPPTSARQ